MCVCMCACSCVSAHTWVCTHLSWCVHVYVHIYIYLNVFVCVYVYMCECIHACTHESIMQVCVHMCTSVSMFECMHNINCLSISCQSYFLKSSKVLGVTLHSRTQSCLPNHWPCSEEGGKMASISLTTKRMMIMSLIS